MANQYIVAVFLDGTLVVDATGPFRSQEKAEVLCEKLNDAAEWSDVGRENFALLAQVVRLRPASEILEAVSE